MLQVVKMAFLARGTARRWTKAAALVVIALGASYACAASAQPATLKLSFFTSDRSVLYQCQIKPFVEAVNADGAGLVQIKVYFSGAISPVQTEQAQFVLKGIADLANTSPAYSPRRFSDSSVLELPGLFRGQREASLTFTRLVASDALAGYRDFFVVGAFVSAGETIHSRKAINRLADLKGLRIRVNNEIEAKTFRKFDAAPVLLPINETMSALNQGKVDAVTVPTALLFEFGFGRLASHHYLLHLGAVPSVVLMSRARLASLPPRAQEIIRKYSGQWLAERESACLATKNREMVARLRADSRRKVVEPSPADRAEAQEVFSEVAKNWAAESPQHRELLSLVHAESQKIRFPKKIGK